MVVKSSYMLDLKLTTGWISMFVGGTPLAKVAVIVEPAIVIEDAAEPANVTSASVNAPLNPVPVSTRVFPETVAVSIVAAA